LKYSIVIPHLSNSKYIDTCIKYIKQNSIYDNEIIHVVDETDVYYAYNKGVYQANYDIVVLLNDDMIVGPRWDEYFPLFVSQETFLTMQVLESNPGKMNGPECIKYDCGNDLDTFDYDKFANYNNDVPILDLKSKGWYMPFVVHRKSFVSYPNIDKFPLYENDVRLIDYILPQHGYKVAQVKGTVYHFSRKATTQFYSEKYMTKRAIFTYNNHQIDEKISYLQKQMVAKFNKNPKCKYEYLFYKKPDGEMVPDQVIDYGLQKLFYNDNYDTILILDIDCVPLSVEALEYIFDQAEAGVFIGNAQRSNHIENNKHIYPAPSCVCITKDMFEKLGKPSFKVTNRGDIGEELCYIAEQQSITIEMFMPSKYEALPYWGNNEEDRKPWPLADGHPEYGIGTTFVNKNGDEMFYHLFQCRLNVFNNLFFLKCASVMLGV